MAQPRERAPYSAIVDRPPLRPLPGGNRIIFWTIVNVEVWDITRPSPGFGQTFQSSDWLAAAGIKYTCEYPYDDEPTRISTKAGPLVTLPYPIECQDVTTLAVQTQEAPYFARKCIDAFDRLYEESAKRPKVFSIAIHPYAAGQAHAIKYLEQIYEHISKFKGVQIWNGREMYE